MDFTELVAEAAAEDMVLQNGISNVCFYLTLSRDRVSWQQYQCSQVLIRTSMPNTRPLLCPQCYLSDKNSRNDLGFGTGTDTQMNLPLTLRQTITEWLELGDDVRQCLVPQTSPPALTP